MALVRSIQMILEGNIFSPLQIDKAIELGEKYKDLPINPYCIHSIGVDPGFSSSTGAGVLFNINE